MRTIFKYTLDYGIGKSTRLMVPVGAKVLTFQMQGDNIVGWFEVFSKAKMHEVEFGIIGTGHEIPDFATYVATVQDGPFVWHIYRLTP